MKAQYKVLSLPLETHKRADQTKHIIMHAYHLFKKTHKTEIALTLPIVFWLLRLQKKKKKTFFDLTWSELHNLHLKTLED